MKLFGIILIVTGIAMLVIRGFSVQTEKKVVDIGPVAITKKENRWVGWPTYAGGLAIVTGLIIIVADRKKAV